MPPRDAAFLGHMLSAVARLSDLVTRTKQDAFHQDWILQDAVIRELEVLGEAAGRVSADFVQAHPEIPWREITGIRHKLIHDYFVVDLDIVWTTAAVNVPEVDPLIRAAAATLGVTHPPRTREQEGHRE